MASNLLVVLMAAAFVSLVVSGSTDAGDSAAVHGTTESAQTRMLTIMGQLVYRQRIALPPDTRAVIELREASTPDGPIVAELHIELQGRQVPVPFTFTVDRANLVAGTPYRVRGTFLSGDRPTWASEPVVVDVESESVDVGMLGMTAVKAQASATTWRCGVLEVSTSYANEAMELTIGTMSLVMRQVGAASGAKFEAIGDPNTTVWEKGHTMTLVVKGRTYPECLKAGATPATFRATGHEPAWRLDITASHITLLTDYGQTRLVMPTPAPEIMPGSRTYVARDERRTMTVTISDQLCVDSMSGMPHPNRVVVLIDGQELNGCGGDPATLLQGVEWVVESLDGAPVDGGSTVTLFFGGDGRVSGSASCNSYTGSYSLTGEGLSMQQPAGTMRMCEAALMNQESAFLSRLTGIKRFEIEEGALILRTADGRAIKARHGR